MHEQGWRVRYMHSDIDTLGRIEIVRDLRLGAYDILVGINLLREGLDIPECALVAILDADKEGFLRSETSLIQTIGRAARHVEGRVLLYADKMTGSLERAMAETKRRRKKQQDYNKEHNITPATIHKNITDILPAFSEEHKVAAGPYQLQTGTHTGMGEAPQPPLLGGNMRVHIETLTKQMHDAAGDLEFETAARLRDEIKRLQETELIIADDPFARQSDVEAQLTDKPSKSQKHKPRKTHKTRKHKK